MFFNAKSKSDAFEIDFPRLSISPTVTNVEALLNDAGIEYKVITDGYIVFPGCVFGSNIPLMIGIHFTPCKTKFIEIFRPSEYYQSENYDIHASFSELSQILREKYGKPIVTTAASINGFPCEQWTTHSYVVNHYIMDRFGPEEHLHINFYKR